MQIGLLIATLIAPVFLAYKHNQQARYMLEGQLHKRSLNQDRVGTEFRRNKGIFWGNALIIVGADVFILTLFFHSFVAIIGVYIVSFFGVVLFVSGVLLKLKAISQIHRSIFRL